MKGIKTALLAGAFALTSTMAFAQAKVDMNSSAGTTAPHSQGTDQGTTSPGAKATTGAGVTAPEPGVTSRSNAEINAANPSGSRPGENTRKPGDMDKSR